MTTLSPSEKGQVLFLLRRRGFSFFPRCLLAQSEEFVPAGLTATLRFTSDFFPSPCPFFSALAWFKGPQPGFPPTPAASSLPADSLNHALTIF